MTTWQTFDWPDSTTGEADVHSVSFMWLCMVLMFLPAIVGGCRAVSHGTGSSDAVPHPITRSPDLSIMRNELSRRLAAAGHEFADVSVGPPFLYVRLQGADLVDLRVLHGYPLGGLDLQRSCIRDLKGIQEFRGLHWLDLSETRIDDLAPLAGMSFDRLDLMGCDLHSITPLQAVRVRELYLSHNQIEDIRPLKGMQLTTLALDYTRVRDLPPIAGMSMESLYIDHTPVHDLSPIAGLPLRVLFVHDTPVSDLTPIQGMPLEILTFDPTTVSNGVEELRQIKTLEHINEVAPEVFWSAYDARRPICVED